jgi:cytochrome c oxidase cbb3-type subunit 3
MSDFNKSENDNIIMNEKEETLLLDHCYDGIEEFDYPLPTWWKWTFWGGIIFGAFYIYFYLVAGGPTLKDEYEKELARVEKVQEEQRLLTGNFDLQEFKQWSNKPESTNMAALVYEENCLSCHEEGGKGDIGPNLTDKHWVNLKEVNPQSIYSFIRVGNEGKTS